MTQVINWSGDSGDGVCIGGGDPKETNHTPLRTMTFKFNTQIKRLSAKDLTISPKHVSKLETSVTTGNHVDAEDIKEIDFVAAPIAIMQSVVKDITNIDINATADLSTISASQSNNLETKLDQLGLGLPSKKTSLGSYMGSVMDDFMAKVEGASATNKLTGANGARMDASTEAQAAAENADLEANASYTYTDDEGNMVTFKTDENGNIIKSSIKEVKVVKMDPMAIEGNAGSKESDDSTSDNANTSKKPTASEFKDLCMNGSIGAWGAMLAIYGGEKGAVLGSLGGPAGTVLGGAIGAMVGYSYGKWMCGLTPNPMDDHSFDPITEAKHGKTVKAYIKKYTLNLAKILEDFDPTTDPTDDSQNSGPYTGPSLDSIIGSNGGTSTGIWNETGSGLTEMTAQMAFKYAMSLGGTSTGPDWF